MVVVLLIAVRPTKLPLVAEKFSVKKLVDEELVVEAFVAEKFVTKALVVVLLSAFRLVM